jgi:hypothetical protein
VLHEAVFAFRKMPVLDFIDLNGYGGFSFFLRAVPDKVTIIVLVFSISALHEGDFPPVSIARQVPVAASPVIIVLGFRAESFPNFTFPRNQNGHLDRRFSCALKRVP